MAHINNGEVPFLLLLIPNRAHILVFKQLYQMLLCHKCIFNSGKDTNK